MHPQRWLDGRELAPSDKYRMQNNVNDYALTVSALTLADRGEYTVRAHNIYGQRECHAFLNVTPVGQSGWRERRRRVPVFEFKGGGGIKKVLRCLAI